MKRTKCFNNEKDLKIMKEDNNKEKVKEDKKKNNEKYNQKIGIKNTKDLSNLDYIEKDVKGYENFYLGYCHIITGVMKNSLMNSVN